jgi:hypothetical protein
MIRKTGASLAFAAICLTAIATLPANAQMMGGYGAPPPVYAPQPYPPQGYQPQPYPPQGYQGNMAPSRAGTSGTEVVTNGPQPSPGDNSSSWSARQNVVQSQQYDRLLETNRGFRQARMRKECGPITDPQLRQDCFASFGQDEPYAGSSSPRRGARSDYGR